jgi:hypothetical protein
VITDDTAPDIFNSLSCLGDLINLYFKTNVTWGALILNIIQFSWWATRCHLLAMLWALMGPFHTCAPLNMHILDVLAQVAWNTYEL